MKNLMGSHAKPCAPVLAHAPIVGSIDNCEISTSDTADQVGVDRRIHCMYITCDDCDSEIIRLDHVHPSDLRNQFKDLSSPPLLCLGNTVQQRVSLQIVAINILKVVVDRRNVGCGKRTGTISVRMIFAINEQIPVTRLVVSP